jgi:hypothetical protein
MSIAAVFPMHHRLDRRGVDAARAVQHRARVAFPVSYRLVFLIEAACFFLIAAGPGSGSLP